MDDDRWEEVRRVYTPPNSIVTKATNVGYDMIMKISYGFTTIEYRDKKGRKKPEFAVLYGDQRLS